MGPAFWCKRFALAFIVAFVILAITRVAKGDALDPAIMFASAWGAVSAAIFTLAGYMRFRRNPSCMLPRGETHDGR
jgi:O-antigen/teichoic acid export membrane protein